MSHSGCDWPQTVDWCRKAIREIAKTGRRPTTGEFRRALRSIGAPFASEQALIRWGKTIPDMVRLAEAQEVEESAPVRTVDHLPLGYESLPADERSRMVWDAMKARAAASLASADAKSFERVRLDHDGPVGLVLMGDMHIGSAATDYHRLEEIARLTQRSDIPIYLLQIGDFFDNMHWLTTECAENGPISLHVEAARRWLSLCANRFLAVCAGNHDLWTVKKAQIDILDYAFAKAGIDPPKYNPYELALDIELGSVEYRFVLRHMVSGHSMWNPAHGVMKWNLLGDTHHDADAIVAGHTHRSGYQKIEAHGRMRHGFQLGAYKLWRGDGYAIEKGFPDRNVEPDMMAVIFPDRKEIKAFPCTEDGILHLERLWSARRTSSGSSSTPKNSQRGAKKTRSTSTRSSSATAPQKSSRAKSNQGTGSKARSSAR